MKQVARDAGVSVATVSLVLNEAPGISTATRELVKAKIRELNYSPDLQARRLSSGMAGTVAMVLPPWSEAFNDPYFMRMLSGALEAVRDRGSQLLLEVCDQRFIDHHIWKDLFAGKRVDGLLIATPYLDHSYLKEVEERHLPVVLINGDRPDLPGLDFMGFDDLQCGLDATNYLIGLGHRRIAHLMGDLNQASARRRLEGYRQAMAAAGLPVREEDLLAGDYLPLESREAFRPILARPPADRPTALFAANDSSALGVMNFLRESGWELPRDLSVVGVDDTGLAANAIPGLTTFRQDIFALSYLAADLFLTKLHSKSHEPLKHLNRMELIERDSCRRL